jgi:osmotically-inducible protein OsmY
MDERFGRRYEDRRYGDDERRFEERRSGEWSPREAEARRYRGGEDYGGRGGYERDDRGFFDRAGDEVRSWFGDEEAERRRREDERRARTRGGSSGWGERDRSWGWGERDRWERGRRDYGEGRDRDRSWDLDEREWAREWGYVDGPYDRTGMSVGRPRERHWGGRDDWPAARGPYSGRGPKGYQRSDERIREDVCDLLCEHGGLDASNVEVQVVAREVTLLGFVPSRTQKRLAEDLADTVSGVSEVHNQIRVEQPGSTGPHTGTQTGPHTGPQDWRNRAA